MALGITGQRQKNKLATVAIETLPTVPASEILKPGSLINRRDLSGKNEGAGNSFNFSFSLEWISTEQIQEG